MPLSTVTRSKTDKTERLQLQVTRDVYMRITIAAAARLVSKSDIVQELALKNLPKVESHHG